MFEWRKNRPLLFEEHFDDKKVESIHGCIESVQRSCQSPFNLHLEPTFKGASGGEVNNKDLIPSYRGTLGLLAD